MILPPPKCAVRLVPRKRLSKAQTASIIALKEACVELERIIQITGTSRATVFRVLRSMKQTASPTPHTASKSIGRPRKTTVEMDNFIVESVESNRKLLPKEVQKMVKEKFGVSLSLSRIRLRLQLAGLHGCVCVRKPLLTMVNKLKRLHWAYLHRNWTIAQWKQVLWSDEKKFELFNSKRRTYCRRRKGEALREDTVQATVKHGGGSAMFWGCFGGLGMGDIFQVHGIMKKEEYHSILVRHAIPSGNRLFGGVWMFQQDNDPKHTSNLCRTYLDRKVQAGQITHMIWPPQSPDLSPIELLWEEVDRQVQAKRPTSLEKLVAIVKETWNEISEDVLEKLLHRMPLLCQAVIDAEGGYFDEKLAAQKKQLVYH